MTNQKKLLLLTMCAPFLLTGCGEGWEFQKTEKLFPYGNKRTAGSGVVYVLAKMMPEKELKIESEMEPVEEAPVVEQEAEPVLDAEEIFEDNQRKGASSKPKKDQTAMMEDDASDVQSYAKASPSAGYEQVEVSSVANTEAEILDDVVESETSELSAEEYIAQAPTQVETPEVRIIDSASDSDNAATVHSYEASFSEPKNEIVAPKRDYGGYKSIGEETLDQIYSDPF